MSMKSNIWGPIATVVFTLVVIFSTMIFQTIGVFLYADSSGSGFDVDSPDNVELAFDDGTVTYWSLGLSAIVCVLLIILIIKLKSGSNLRDYLALNPVPLKRLVKWIGIGALALVVIQIVFSIIPQMLGIPVDVGDVATEFGSADIPLLYVLTIAVLVPIFEEVLFRGFLFKGLISTRLGAVGTIIVTSLIFSVMHVQYDLIVLANVFFIGILLGTARYRTNSLLTPVVLHVLLNGLSMLPAFL